MTAQQAPKISSRLEESGVKPCPVCGSYTDPGAAALVTTSALLAVCDVLVVRALEALGKRLVRVERARFARLGSRPWHEAHTIWRPDEAQVIKTLHASWDVIPALLVNHGVNEVSAREVQQALDEYVRDLAITGSPHLIGELRYRLETRLGLELADIPPYQPARLS